MIARLRGVLASVAPVVVVDVGGVGYQVALTPQAVSDLPPVGEEVVVHTHLHVREDEMSLYGFLSSAERDLFRILITTSGVGPKVAMSSCRPSGPTSSGAPSSPKTPGRWRRHPAWASARPNG